MSSLLIPCNFEKHPLRIIFLDCDGVLCLARSLTCDFEDDDVTLLFDTKTNYLPLEKCCLKILTNLIQNTS